MGRLILQRLNPKKVAMGNLNFSGWEFDDLYDFISVGLMDPKGSLENLIPQQVPRGRSYLLFNGGQW